MSKTLKLFIICGEASGDLLASGVVKALQEKLNNNENFNNKDIQNILKNNKIQNENRSSKAQQSTKNIKEQNDEILFEKKYNKNDVVDKHFYTKSNNQSINARRYTIEQNTDKNKVQLDKLELYGLGGENLQKLGLKSLFDISQLSVIGFVDVFKNISLFKKLIKQTAKKIAEIKPDVVLSVDSGGFCFRACKMAKDILTNEGLQECKTKFYHYVAPAVWAYGKERGKKLAKIYDAIFCLFDFEPPYFTKYGLEAISVPNPYFSNSVEKKTENFTANFKTKYNITKPIIAITLGSREMEVKIHAEIIRQALINDANNKSGKKVFDKYNLIFLALPKFYGLIANKFEDFENCKIVTTKSDKDAVINGASFAIAKSGTNVMEFLTKKIKTLVFYKMNPLNYFIGRLFIKTKFANIINVIEDKMIVPELLQFNCTPNAILQGFKDLEKGKFNDNLKLAFDKANKIIGANVGQNAAKINAPQIISQYIINKLTQNG